MNLEIHLNDHNFMELLFRSGSLTNGFLQVFLFETVFMVFASNNGFCKQQELSAARSYGSSLSFLAMLVEGKEMWTR